MRFVSLFLLTLAACSPPPAVPAPSAPLLAPRAGSVQYAAGTPEHERLHALKAELRRLVIAQEAYFSDRLQYATVVDSLRAWYRPTPQVIPTMVAADRAGWAVLVRHVGLPGVVCRIAVGTPPGDLAWARENEPQICVHEAPASGS